MAIYIQKHVFGMSGLVFGVSGLVFGMSGLVWGCMNFFFEWLDLFWWVWTCFLACQDSFRGRLDLFWGVWTCCFFASGLVLECLRTCRNVTMVCAFLRLWMPTGSR
jgi:hypothetical protein